MYISLHTLRKMLYNSNLKTICKLTFSLQGAVVLPLRFSGLSTHQSVQTKNVTIKNGGKRGEINAFLKVLDKIMRSECQMIPSE